jgi:hypothetical protein
MMAYQKGVVASIIVDGKPVREFNFKDQRTCKIPFGTEYKIRLKNKTNSRVLISVDIDETDVLCFKRLILEKNCEMELERFVDDLGCGNKFKFISLEEGTKTGEIQDPTNKNNGLITIKAYKEKDAPAYLRSTTSFHTQTVDQGPSVSYTSCACAATNGATVQGGNSNQQFQESYEQFDLEENPIEISIRLIGIPVRERFGVFLDNNKRPSYEFKSRIEAFDFIRVNDFGESKVMIKPV